MRMQRAVTAAVAAGILGACGGEPARLEGTSLSGSGPLLIRSALFAPRYSGQNGPFAGKVLLSEEPEACERLRRQREAERRREAPSVEAGSHRFLVLFLSGTQLQPGALPAGRYLVRWEDPVSSPLAVVGALAKSESGVSETLGVLGAGTMSLLDDVPLRAGAEARGEMDVELEAPAEGTLVGEFTATYCEYL